MKKFNDTGVCIPEIHYMVDMSNSLLEIKKRIDDGEYFTINRGRQYGKTTTLRSLRKILQDEYIVVNLDFQMFGEASFSNENIFSLAFGECFLESLSKATSPALLDMEEEMKDRGEAFVLFHLFRHLSRICGNLDKKIVLMIDEVDSASNNQVFLDFLAQLRGYYLSRYDKPTFWSVILAGVYDVKNLRRKFPSADEHKLNSPWNIASNLDVELSFSREGIAGMLREYEQDCGTGMNICEMATLLYDYTSGYPFLVSRICKLLDEEIEGSGGISTKSMVWSRQGFLEAVRKVLVERSTLFESLVGKLRDYPELNDIVFNLLFVGKSTGYNLNNQVISLASMFGFVKNNKQQVAISNRIFETMLYDLFLSTEEMKGCSIYKASLQEVNRFVVNQTLNMRLILERFVVHFHDLYGDSDEQFLEEDGRKYFLLYLRSIINGVGNYYVESRTRSMGRTDVIVDYLGEQYIIEMKIWRGDEYHKRGEKQLARYLEDYQKTVGYMLSFNFNKDKEVGVKEVFVGAKKIIEAVV